MDPSIARASLLSATRVPARTISQQLRTGSLTRCNDVLPNFAPATSRPLRLACKLWKLAAQPDNVADLRSKYFGMPSSQSPSPSLAQVRHVIPQEVDEELVNKW